MRLEKSLFRGSLILLVAFGLFNVLNFFFQFAMARMLSVAEYGVLAALFSIFYILLVFTESIQTIITKYSVKENEPGKLKNLIKKSLSKGLFWAIVLFILNLLISIPLSYLLDIEYVLLAVNGLVIFLVFFSPITRGVLQGRKKFGSLGVNMAIESSSKLALGIFLVFIGFGVMGAIAGNILAGVLAFAFSLFPLKKVLRSKELKNSTEGIYDYARPAFVITLVIIVFYSIDVVLAKMVFSAETAGSYAIASILAKIIFWGTAPISKAMFPLSAESGSNRKNIFVNALLILFLIILFSSIFLYYFPEFIIKIFAGQFISASSSVLFYIGLAMGLISIANLVLLYKLSIGKVKGYPYLFVLLAIEIISMVYFSDTLLSFSIAFVVASLVFLIGSIFLLRKK
ncbi:MAG: oligosaccharide flippase family protein [Nanoarchaeota archaeon]